MRYCFAASLLLAMLPLMRVWAAPAPAPSAIFQLGPPSKGETEEQFCKKQIEGQTSHASLSLWWAYLKESKLPSITSMQDPRPWLAKNLRITEEQSGRCLRFTFHAGSRQEQVVILNALLRVNLYWHDTKWGEECFRIHQKNILELEKRSKTAQNAQEVASYEKGINELRTTVIPELRSAISREKQFTVMKWAK
jgi:hypothetical protein